MLLKTKTVKYNRKIILDKTTIIIHLSEQPLISTKETVIFGNPFGFKDSYLKLDNNDFGNTVKGYWAKLDFKKDSFSLVNDILGGYRLYYSKKNNQIVISDDYKYILSELQISPVKNDIEYQYWQKHNFTTGKSTFIKGIEKISPASILEIKNNKIQSSTYFKDVIRKPNSKKHQKAVHKDLLETFNTIKEQSKNNVLLFSGGKDSCLLLQYLLKDKIPFTPVFLKLEPANKYGASDLKKVRSISKKLNLNLEEIVVNVSNISEKTIEQIIEKQIFDKHYSLLHYLGYNAIREKYGKDCLVINGQSSDSILSFGPSENSLMSYFRRNIMYNSNSITSKLGLFLLKIKTKKSFKLPSNELEKLFALFDEFKYTRVIDTGLAKDYKDYIYKYIKTQTSFLQNYDSKEMYVKIASFNQGSDNQVVVNSSKYNQLNTIMPFATPEIIYNTVKYKDENLEIKSPKYVIEKILKEEFSFYYKKADTKNIKVNDLTIDLNNTSSKKMTKLFLKRVKNLVHDNNSKLND